MDAALLALQGPTLLFRPPLISQAVAGSDAAQAVAPSVVVAFQDAGALDKASEVPSYQT